MHPVFEAERIVEGFGGKKKVISSINKAGEEQDYSWATQSVGYLYKVYPNDPEVTQITANQLRMMGQLTDATIPRSWYLGQANALENNANILHAVLPSAEQILKSEPRTYVDLMRVRINPELNLETNKLLVLEFTDSEAGSKFGLHVRKGVAEFIPSPIDYYKSADITIALPRVIFARYYSGDINLQDLLTDQEVIIKGDKSEAALMLNQFDQSDTYLSNYKFQSK